MAKFKTKILLEIIDDVAIKYPDTRDFIEQKLIEKWISIDKVIYFFSKSKSKTFLQTKHVYQSYNPRQNIWNGLIQ